MRCNLRTDNHYYSLSDRTDRNVTLTDCISASILDNPRGTSVNFNWHSCVDVLSNCQVFKIFRLATCASESILFRVLHPLEILAFGQAQMKFCGGKNPPFSVAKAT